MTNQQIITLVIWASWIMAPFTIIATHGTFADGVIGTAAMVAVMLVSTVAMCLILHRTGRLSEAIANNGHSKLFDKVGLISTLAGALTLSAFPGGMIAAFASLVVAAAGLINMKPAA